MTSWFRSWHGAPTDTKWLAIARRASVAPGVVSAVVWALMDYASQSTDRGSVAGFDAEAYAAFAGFDQDDVTRVVEALRDKGVIEHDRLSAWDKRQPKREDNSAERVKRYREKKREGDDQKRDVTQCNAPESDTETDTESVVARERAPTTPPDLEFERKKREYADCLGDLQHTEGALDITPLTALQAKGYDWSKDILQPIRERIASGKPLPILTSASYWKPMLRERHAIPEKPKAEPVRETTWIGVDDDRWPDLAELEARRTGKPCQPIESKHHDGKGRYFDSDLVAGVIPAFLRRA